MEKKTAKRIKFLIIALFLPAFFSCSLSYSKTQSAETLVPEITFYDANMKRIESGNLKMNLDASQIEQYKDADEIFAQNIAFKTWNNSNEEETEGGCNLISINNPKKQYNLFGSIRINVFSEKMLIEAENLMWNGNREQLVSGKNDTVSIKRDDIKIEGTGFSASGVSKSFNFSNSIKGIIVEDEEGDFEIPEEIVSRDELVESEDDLNEESEESENSEELADGNGFANNSGFPPENIEYQKQKD